MLVSSQHCFCLNGLEGGEVPCEWRTGVAIPQWGAQPPGSINGPGSWQRDLALPDGTNLTASSLRLFKQKQCWLERWRAEVRCCTTHLGRWPPDWLGRKCGDWIGKKKKHLQKSQKSIVHLPQFQPGSGSQCLSGLKQPYQQSLAIFMRSTLYSLFFIIMSPCLFLYYLMKASTAWLKHCNNLLLHAVWSPVNHSAIVYTTASCSSNNSWTNCPLLRLTAYIIALVRTFTCKVSCLMWSFFLMSLYLIPGHRYVQLL